MPRQKLTITPAAIHGRLAEAFTRSTLTQPELSERSGIPQSTLSGYLSGRVQPTAPRLAALCHALNVESDWLLGLDFRH